MKISATLILCALAGGCELVQQYPPPNLPPAAADRFRTLSKEVKDERLRQDLSTGMDDLVIAWPVRETAGVSKSPELGEPKVIFARLRELASQVPEPELREPLTDQIEIMQTAWGAGNTDKGRAIGWYLVPDKVRIDSFTRFVTPEMGTGTPYLEARVQVLDRDTNPMRTAGKFRIELFEFQKQSADPRGNRTAQWDIDIQEQEDNRRHFDVLINGYTFNLDLEGKSGQLVAGAKFVVEATFIRPDGTRVYPSNYRFVEIPLPDDGTETARPETQRGTGQRTTSNY